ncbi:MAG: diacylglycerol kinase [Phycisphaeraceae bacterium]|nr:diacylglycerol kinase [Phycisphaeraceae bacterium]
MAERRFSFDGRVRSVRHAVRGIAVMLRTQHNAWVHALATVLVVAAGLLLRIDRADWPWIIVAVVGVWTAEALNTALELLADVASPQFHPLVMQAKDVAAGAVLIAAMGAALIGALVLGPAMIRTLC